MPKATLEFDLPDEQGDFRLATSAMRWYGAMQTLAEWLRKQVKYAEHSEEVADAYQACHGELYKCMSDEGISFDDAEN